MSLARPLSRFLAIACLLAACAKKKDEASTVPTSPTAGSAISFSNKTATSVTLTWGAASDDATAVADLQYLVVSSGNSNISTASDAVANGTVVMNWTANTLTKNVTSLSASTTYYFAVVVKDADGNMAIETNNMTTSCAGKIMFLATASNASFSGASGADALCNAQKPTGFSSATFKAMLTDGTSRRACYTSGNDNCSSSSTGRLDWVFSANQILCSSDYSTRVGTTNSNALLSVSAAKTLSSSATTTFTGFNTAWGSSATNCSGWTTTSGAGISGDASATYDGLTNNSFIAANAATSCNSAGTIYCVEQ